MREAALFSLLREWVPEILSGTLFPLLCPMCGKNPPLDGTPNMFCPECFSRLPVYSGKVCRLCGGELDTVFDVCLNCMSGEQRPWERGFSLFRCAGAAGDCVHLFKYAERTDFAPAFGLLAAGMLRKESDVLYDYITPVPLHWTRFLTRGYNQSALFACEISRRMGIPYRDFLRRIRKTPRQALMTGKERKCNIHGAFSILHSTELQNRAILLADDVMTTGSTLSEAARVLRNAGAARVDVLVIARRRKRS